MMYVVDGYITIEMTPAEAKRWNTGTIGTAESDALIAHALTDDGETESGTIRELLDRGTIGEEDLANPAVEVA